MEKWEELLKNPEISDFINRHQGAATRITMATQKLAENSDALEALMKLLPALDHTSRQPVSATRQKTKPLRKPSLIPWRRTLAENSILPIKPDLLKKSSARVGGKKFEMPCTRRIGSFCSCPILPMSWTGLCTK